MTEVEDLERITRLCASSRNFRYFEIQFVNDKEAYNITLKRLEEAGLGERIQVRPDPPVDSDMTDTNYFITFPGRANLIKALIGQRAYYVVHAKKNKSDGISELIYENEHGQRAFATY